MRKHHKRLQQMLQAHRMIHKIDEARQANTDASVQTEHRDEPNVVGEAKAAMHGVQEMQASCVDGLMLDRRIPMLNNDQERIFKQVSDHLKHQHRHENSLCQCTQFQPCSLVVWEEQANPSLFRLSKNTWQNNENQMPKTPLLCCGSTSTGLAAFNVDGVTIHCLFQLLIGHEGQTATDSA